MDIHVITPNSVEHILSVVDGKVIIVPPPVAPAPTVEVVAPINS